MTMKWFLTQDGQIVNMDQVSYIQLNTTSGGGYIYFAQNTERNADYIVINQEEADWLKYNLPRT
jgi:regulator of protease activity HflC (stomatin/prohibitin superfamily)